MAPSTKPPTTVNNLTPAKTYAFQVRAFGKFGVLRLERLDGTHVYIA